MKTNDIDDKIKQVQYRNGFNLGARLFKYQNSKIVKTMLQHISELNKDDTWAVGLANGFEEARSMAPNKIQRLNELDLIFDKNKENEKDQDKDLER